MRHRMRGRKLGRNSSHRRAMFRNMACSLIRSTRVDEDEPNRPKVPGRIVTTVAKAKELRPYVERLITIAKKAQDHLANAETHATTAARDSDAWKQWRNSSEWNEWNQAVAPALALRRRAFALLRDNEAVDVLFTDLAERFAERSGGYTRVIRLASVRLGDAGPQALIEFVGERDREKMRRRAPLVTQPSESEDESGEAEDDVVDESAAADDAASTEAETDSAEEASATDEEAAASDEDSETPKG